VDSRGQFVPLIKRYPNRKLYDTEAKQYITLDGIARLIRQGEEVSVVDHATGEDLTALTLTQVILEQEKRRGGFLPQTVLAGLIQAGGERMSTLRGALASPLELARHVDEEIERRVQSLISRGELAADDGMRLRDKLVRHEDRASGPGSLSDEDLQRLLDERRVPTQDDLQQVFAQLEALAAKLDEIITEQESVQAQ
jgi:polyhydroxyalkanoate synthesis repressor PhaR